MRLIPPAVLLLVAVGCLPTEPEDSAGSEPVGLAAELTELSSCADASFAMRNTEDSWALFLDVEGVAAEAHSAGDTVSHSYTLPDPAVQARVEQGENLTHTHCNDALWLETTVEHSWELQSGELQLRTTPTGEPKPWGSAPAEAELTLSEAWFRDPTGERADVWISELSATGSIGWLPG